ncbi:hypothetical protein G6D77_004451, partial [Salmonella enterica]|nr:hypothetical protein [Salmonella enterica]
MDFDNKNDELKQKKELTQILLHNSVILKITGRKAEISMDNNLHIDIKI